MPGVIPGGSGGEVQTCPETNAEAVTVQFHDSVFKKSGVKDLPEADSSSPGS